MPDIEYTTSDNIGIQEPLSIIVGIATPALNPNNNPNPTLNVTQILTGTANLSAFLTLTLTSKRTLS